MATMNIAPPFPIFVRPALVDHVAATAMGLNGSERSGQQRPSTSTYMARGLRRFKKTTAETIANIATTTAAGPDTARRPNAK
jgi:hypothetical protein